MQDFWDTLIRHIEVIITLPLCLLTVLAVHELGHYAVARGLGLHVESVTFGRGRVLWSRADTRGTRWALHVWPLRAHVQIENVQYTLLTMHKKLLVILAGPIANFLLPVVLFFLFFVTLGQPAVPTIVTAVEPAMPAYKAGLRPGDRIIAINDEAVQSLDEIQSFTYALPPKPLKIRYRRAGEVFEISLLPMTMQYVDLNGVRRAHGRIGLSTWQQPYDLVMIKSVNGVPMKTPDKVRAALLENMGKRTALGLLSADGKVYISEVDLSAKSNPYLGYPDHRESNRLYLGTLRDNHYLPLTILEGAHESVFRAGTMIGHVARLPFNLFPVDKEWISPDTIVSKETSYLQVRLYIFVFYTSLCSCLIGFLNLLPFPRLDGGEALLLVGEALKHRPLDLKEKATILIFGLLLFYAAVFGLNMNDMRFYYMFQMYKASAAETN